MFTTLIISIFSVSVLALLCAWFLFSGIIKIPIASKKLFDLENQGGKNLFSDFWNSAKVVFLVSAVIFTLLLYLLSWQSACGFLLGIVLSMFIGFAGGKIVSATSFKASFLAKNDLSLSFNIGKKAVISVFLIIFPVAILVLLGTYLLFFDKFFLISVVLGSCILPVFSQINNNQPKIYEFSSGYFSSLLAGLSVGVLSMQSEFPEKIAIISPIILASIIMTSIFFSLILLRYKSEKGILFKVSAIVSVVLISAGIYLFGRFVSFSYFNLWSIGVTVVGVLMSSIIIKSSEYLLKEFFSHNHLMEIENPQFENIKICFKKSQKATRYIMAVASFVVFSLIILYFASGNLSLANPTILTGLVVGGIFPYLFIFAKKRGDVLVTSAVLILPIILAVIFGNDFYFAVLAGIILIGFFLSFSREDGLLSAPLAKFSLLIPILSLNYLSSEYSILIRLIVAGVAILLLGGYLIWKNYIKVKNWFIKIAKKYAREPKTVKNKINWFRRSRSSGR